MRAGTPSELTEDIQAVLQSYDLGELRGYKKFTRGRSSTNVLLVTDNGKKVLKKYRLPLNVIQYEHSLLRHLASKNFKSPRLVHNKENRTYVEIRGQHFAVYDCVEGFCYTDFYWSHKQRLHFLGKAAKILAQYHRIVGDFVPEGKKLDGFRPGGQIRWRDSQWLLKHVSEALLLAERKERKEKDAFDRFALANAERFRDLPALEQLIEKDHQLPRLAIHGDYGPWNVLFQTGGELAAVIDYGASRLDFRVYDVMKAILYFSGAREDEPNYDRARYFLNTYHLHYPLISDEMAIMADVLSLMYLRSLAESVRRHYFDKVHKWLPGLRRLVSVMDFLKNHGTDFVSYITADI